jgi:hypothetical protein
MGSAREVDELQRESGATAAEQTGHVPATPVGLGTVRDLQRIAGNAAVSRLLAGNPPDLDRQPDAPPEPEPLPALSRGTLPDATPDGPAAEELRDAALEAGQEGMAGLEDRARDGLTQIQRALHTEQGKLEAAGRDEEASVARSFATARQDVGRSIVEARRGLADAALTAQSQLDSTHAADRRRAREAFASRQARTRQLGAHKGDQAVATADQAAQDARSAVEGYASSARHQGEGKAQGARGGSAEIVEARRAAARAVASDTAQEIGKSVDQTVAELRGLGPETKPEFMRQAAELATQLGRQLPAITMALDRTRQDATSALGAGATAGARALTDLERSLGHGLAELERSVRRSLRQGVGETREALGASGREAMEAIRAQHDAASQAGADVIATILVTAGNHRVRRLVARKMAPEVRSQVKAGFLSTEQRAQLAMSETALCFSQAALETLDALRGHSEQAQRQATTAVSSATGGVERRQRELISQLTAAVKAAAESNDRIVTGAERSLDGTIADLDGRFTAALADFRTRLGSKVADAAGRAREPLGSLDARMDEAMDRAEDKLDQSWLERQWSNIVESINWGMLAGLLVGLFVTILVVAFVGTGIGALILAGALAGALSVAATTLTNNAIEGRATDWGELGKNMLVGAAFGAVGGALGGGVTGALGKGLAQGLVTEATTVALGKAANVATGVVLGVVQNVIHGDPWDRNLLMNVAQGTLMTYGPVAEGIQGISQNARAAAVDGGIAVNVTPAEAAASAARTGGRSATSAPQPPPARSGATADASFETPPGGSPPTGDAIQDVDSGARANDNGPPSGQALGGGDGDAKAPPGPGPDVGGIYDHTTSRQGEPPSAIAADGPGNSDGTSRKTSASPDGTTESPAQSARSADPASSPGRHPQSDTSAAVDTAGEPTAQAERPVGSEAPMSEAGDAATVAVRRDQLMDRVDAISDAPGAEALMDRLERIDIGSPDPETRAAAARLLDALEADVARAEEAPRFGRVGGREPDRFDAAEPDRIPELDAGEPPKWAQKLENFRKGNEFNEAQRDAYAARELELSNGKKVDGYTENSVIVSRKRTQLAEIPERYAEEYVNEFLDKYGPGNEVADTPRNRELYPHLVGTRLQGDMILEVPVQEHPVPPELGEWARRWGVIIRDDAGHVYN